MAPSPFVRHRLTRRYRREPGSIDETNLAPADRFASLASLRYDRSDEPPRPRAAAELLRERPGLVDDGIAAAAAAFDPDAVRRHLARDPRSASTETGPFRWEPLLYLTFSRLPVERPVEDVLATARLLLDAGGHVEAGYLWGGLTPPFTALTGAFGGGEMGPGRQPEHAGNPALARLLLERGADPNDGQALYNRMFVPGTAHLELLFEYGLGAEPATGGWWRRNWGAGTESIDDMLDRQVRWARDHRYLDRLDLFARNGIDVGDIPDPPEPPELDARIDGQTALHTAVWNGDLEAVRDLLAAGADPTIRDERFGGTADDWARFCHQDTIAELLRTFGSRPPAGPM